MPCNFSRRTVKSIGDYLSAENVFRFAAAGSEDNEIRMWDMSLGKEVLCMSGHANTVNSLCFSSDGAVLASGGGDGAIRVWNVKSSLDECESLISPHKSFFTKNTPIYDTLFTDQNLLLVGGPFMLPSSRSKRMVER